SNFLSSALFERMENAGLDIDEISRGKLIKPLFGVIIHSITQINTDEMIICWEGVDIDGERTMMNAKVNTNW
ncbi:MAG: hypothetical protein GY861_20585, partial [bacterium]|nr:hypothetical protein [bacterium]